VGTPKRPDKIPNLLDAIREAIEDGRLREAFHAVERKAERRITRQEYQHVLRNGYHEKKKDEFKPEYNAWSYAVRGKTLDERDLRVVVSFELDDDQELLLIVTVIEVTNVQA